MIEQWARIRLSVAGSGPAPEAITKLLGDVAEADPHEWDVAIEQSSGESLDVQLERLESALDVLAGYLLEDAEVQILLSWRPKPGQDGLAMSPLLLAALAGSGATLRIDTYTD